MTKVLELKCRPLEEYDGYASYMVTARVLEAEGDKDIEASPEELKNLIDNPDDATTCRSKLLSDHNDARTMD